MHTKALAGLVPTQTLSDGNNQAEPDLGPDGKRCGGRLCWFREEGFKRNEGELVGNQSTVLERKE